MFEVPLRSICRKDYPNVLTAGRGACGEGYGWDLLRVIPPAIITGQAAGEVACMAIDNKVGVASVDIKKLQPLKTDIFEKMLVVFNSANADKILLLSTGCLSAGERSREN